MIRGRKRLPCRETQTGAGPADAPSSWMSSSLYDQLLNARVCSAKSAARRRSVVTSRQLTLGRGSQNSSQHHPLRRDCTLAARGAGVGLSPRLEGNAQAFWSSLVWVCPCIPGWPGLRGIANLAARRRIPVGRVHRGCSDQWSSAHWKQCPTSRSTRAAAIG